jgi:hypothetical protein
MLSIGRTRTNETASLPKRHEMIQRLKEGEEYDLLVIGGGATGSGLFHVT